MSTILLATSGCMTTRVVAQYDKNRPSREVVTTWPLFWGLVQPKDIKTDARCPYISQVEAKTNLGYILIAAATVGIVVPMRLEYSCLEEDPGDSHLN